MKTLPSDTRPDAVIRTPGSKSITHRALIAAALAPGESDLDHILISQDTRYTAEALRQMGIEIDIHGDKAHVCGKGGRFAPFSAPQEIFLGNSGTSFRLLLSIAALCTGTVVLTGTPRMQERPVGDLVAALKHLGVDAVFVKKDGFPPIRIQARGITGGATHIAGHKSSQFISSLLLAAPCAKTDVEILVDGDVSSKPYVDLTLQVMERFGVSVQRDGFTHFKITADQHYRPGPFGVEADVSSASYFWAAAAVCGGRVITDNINARNTFQGDIGLLDILEKMGCRVEKHTRRVAVSGGELTGITADLNSMPDMVPSLAAVALFAKGKTVIRNVAHLKDKESDRLASIATEWGKLGVRVDLLDDGLIIHGQERLQGAQVCAHDDHRIAMSLAVIGLKVPGIRLDDPGCVEKSFPHFWDIWEQMISDSGGNNLLTGL